MKELQTKAMAGKLRDEDLIKLRKHGSSAVTGINSFLSKLRLLRRRGAELASMPPGAIEHLDAAISLIDKAVPGSGK